MMMSVMKNNNLLHEYAANSATTSINHYIINMTIETDNEHIKHHQHHNSLSYSTIIKITIIITSAS